MGGDWDDGHVEAEGYAGYQDFGGMDVLLDDEGILA
jgi:hypothetical protein